MDEWENAIIGVCQRSSHLQVEQEPDLGSSADVILQSRSTLPLGSDYSGLRNSEGDLSKSFGRENALRESTGAESDNGEGKNIQGQESAGLDTERDGSVEGIDAIIFQGFVVCRVKGQFIVLAYTVQPRYIDICAW